MIVLANPEEVKNRKGHKTDRKDSEHLADLLRHDHIRASYIPQARFAISVILLGDGCN